MGNSSGKEAKEKVLKDVNSSKNVKHKTFEAKPNFPTSFPVEEARNSSLPVRLVEEPLRPPRRHDVAQKDASLPSLGTNLDTCDPSGANSKTPNSSLGSSAYSDISMKEPRPPEVSSDSSAYSDISIKEETDLGPKIVENLMDRIGRLGLSQEADLGPKLDDLDQSSSPELQEADLGPKLDGLYPRLPELDQTGRQKADLGPTLQHLGPRLDGLYPRLQDLDQTGVQNANLGPKLRNVDPAPQELDQTGLQKANLGPKLQELDQTGLQEANLCPALQEFDQTGLQKDVLSPKLQNFGPTLQELDQSGLHDANLGPKQQDLGLELQELDQTGLQNANLGPALQELDQTGLQKAVLGPTLQESDQTGPQNANLGPKLQELDQTGLQKAVLGSALQESEQAGLQNANLGPKLQELDQAGLQKAVLGPTLQESDQKGPQNADLGPKPAPNPPNVDPDPQNSIVIKIPRRKPPKTVDFSPKQSAQTATIVEKTDLTSKLHFYEQQYQKISQNLQTAQPENEPSTEPKPYNPYQVEIVLSEFLRTKKSKLKSNVVSIYSKRRFEEIKDVWKQNDKLETSENWDDLLFLDDSVLITLRIVKSLNQITIKDWPYLISMFRTLKETSFSKISFYKSQIASHLLKKTTLGRIYALLTSQNDEYEISKVAPDILCYYEDIILYSDHMLQDTSLLLKVLEECSRFHPKWHLIDKLKTKKNTFLDIYPTDILTSNKYYRNLQYGAFDSLRHYVKTHVSLLKEDFELSLRKGITNYVRGVKDDISVYEKVKLCFTISSENDEYYIQLTETQICELRRTHWPSSSKFYLGSLILLSKDNFMTYIIAKCTDRREIEKGTGRLYISFFMVPKEIDLTSTYTMVEPNDYFDPYFSVMKCLKMLPKYPFPFQKYIIYGQNDIKRSPYAFSDFKIFGHKVTVGDKTTFPNEETLKINEYQRNCLYDALNNEICLIQGPPGTGKTFMCSLIIKVLLENRNLWKNDYNTPILVVCFKNQSLDELLENLLREEINVLRLGSNTKNEELINFYSLGGMESPKGSFAVGWTFGYLRRKEKEVKTALDEMFSNLDAIRSNRGVIKFEVLQKIMNAKDVIFLKSDFIGWLFDVDAQTLISLKVLKTPEYELIHPNKRDYQALESDLYHKICSKMDDLYNTKARNAGDPELLTRSKDKYAMYHFWIEKVVEEYKKEITRLTQKLCDLKGKLSETFKLFDARKIAQSNVDVMGMTTNAAARLDVMLEEIKPRILIVEEAAEVLESHCVAALNQHCQHLILLGDHKQLRPLSKNIELEHCNLSLSLFERLANNGISPSVLHRQYRMRPEISSLITPAIYDYLEDDESVKTFPNVAGVLKNVFFIDHRFEENQSYASKSVFNRFEVHYALNLALYFINQGYDGTEITIIAMYAEQEKILHRERAYLKKEYPAIEHVIIATVDSYQGKQNKIVLLSLVRNNKNANIGFLNIVNRVCVALSRARHGLYIFGNMDNLRRKSPMWRTVEQSLIRQDAIGPNLTIVCQPHGRRTVIATADDLKNHLDGGCDRPCKGKLLCGHTCTFRCHGRDPLHLKEFACAQPCQESMDCGHRCQLKCHNELTDHICQPCLDLILQAKIKESELKEEEKDKKKNNKKDKKKKSNDDSESDTIPDIDILTINVCDFTFDCGHDCQKDCIVHDSEMKCERKCLKRLPCRHICKLNCHSGFDHKGEYSCGEICGARLKCGHVCESRCHPDRDTKHSIIYRCKRICDKKLECGHRCGYECHVFADDSHSGDFSCAARCDSLLPCGHLCASDCHKATPEKHDCDKCSHNLMD